MHDSQTHQSCLHTAKTAFYAILADATTQAVYAFAHHWTDAGNCTASGDSKGTSFCLGTIPDQTWPGIIVGATTDEAARHQCLLCGQTLTAHDLAFIYVRHMTAVQYCLLSLHNNCCPFCSCRTQLIICAISVTWSSTCPCIWWSAMTLTTRH